ncbi:Man1-Src1p-C-terminal domain-containing protein [Hygrophoropsis aurantiaca]|uniref:Man1-Src1p-C-terminal domain-containing protein n=1 Tax=Hygrophoropsis aurantiaca TaxID=72124 RepID=A0ACB8AS49_9AGAM|nr:Man1-Src1p-C-terminal domain-containing protein [Hygrophoropsis aurantiaca]
MSRTSTTAQIIALGEYLKPEFDPSNLTVSQLLGVLGYHNIQYPTPYTKPKLVQLFNAEIKSKSSPLKRERIRKENSLASDDGITDGITGKPINGGTKVPARRSSRRPSRAPSDDEEPVMRPDPPKRRRSSAQPNLGGPTRTKVASAQPVLMEESEPEEDEPEESVRKIGRSKKTTQTAGKRARRISVAEDSGWEDNNIFQSGAESSSPARPSPTRTRAPRKSAAPRKSRHSMSAPPQISPASSPPKVSIFQAHAQHSPPQSNFNPQLPANISHQPRVSVPSERRTQFKLFESPSASTGAPKVDEYNVRDDNLVDHPSASDDIETDAEADIDEFADIQAAALAQRHADGSVITRHRSAPPIRSSGSHVLRFIYFVVLLVSSGVIANYKMESSALGYCDAGSDSNSALKDFREHLSAVETCNRENQTLLHLPPIGSTSQSGDDGIPCPPLSLIPLPHPSSCTPCPEYATCTPHNVVCNSGYLLRPHPVLALLAPFGYTPSSTAEVIWKAISYAADGIPGLGPVAFPQRCVEDPRRKRHIGALGKAIEALLGQEKGRLVCAGSKEGREKVVDSEGGEARKWGLEVETLRETMKGKTAPHLLESFDETFNEAIQQLVQWGGVILGEDIAGKRYLAHKSPNLTWNCQLTVKSRNLWEKWRTTVAAFVAIISAGFFLRRRQGQRLIEGKRVAELVQIALDTLRNQELAHHTDPVTAPHPYLSSLQLRDLILQDEHSIPARRRLWDQVERVVEGNANVRANLEEVQGGDELRVWRWVGTAGRSNLRKLEKDTS